MIDKDGRQSPPGLRQYRPVPLDELPHLATRRAGHGLASQIGELGVARGLRDQNEIDQGALEPEAEGRAGLIEATRERCLLGCSTVPMSATCAAYDAKCRVRASSS
jgi:hypothetical protein